MLHIQTIEKHYKKQKVLSIQSLEIKPSSIVGLYGHNGAGKSTLLKILSGSLKPSFGKWTLYDKSIEYQYIQYLEQIGYMPDDFTIPPYLTVKEFLTFYAELKKISKAHIIPTLQKVGLDEIKNNPTTNLSKGMRQRLLLAQAIISEPNLLLLDEPTNGLDNEWVEELKSILIHLQQKGTIVIISSHHHDFLNDICTRKLTLSHGILTENEYAH